MPSTSTSAARCNASPPPPKKKPRVVSCQAASAFAGTRFSFGFSDTDADTDDVDADAALITAYGANIAADGHTALVRTPFAGFARGDRIDVLWNASSFSQLAVVAGGAQPEEAVFAAPSDVLVIGSAQHRCKLGDDVFVLDYVLEAALGGAPRNCLHFSRSPLMLDSGGVQSLVWPLHVDAFMRRVYQRQTALVVQGAAQRLQLLRDDFHGFEVAAMLDDASRIVVWMKDVKRAQMQYIDVADPSIALACYRSGHSLYFNPSMEIQRKYIEPLCQDLGMDFGASMDGGLGGDIEVFAVSGKHHTPWHFDSQQNFTIQLQGTKRWSLKRGPLHDPLTNLHMRSSNQASISSDLMVHSSCGASSKALTPPSDDDPDVVSFILRPGSCLFFPSGMWHKVECLEDGGSLSMNFSLDGSRWVDLLSSRLPSLLWQDERWRSRIRFSDAEAARSHFDTLLSDLRQRVSTLTARDFLPDSIFLDTPSQPCSGGAEPDDVDLDHASLRRNPLATLASSAQPGLYTVHLGVHKRAVGSGEFMSAHSHCVHVPSGVYRVADHLMRCRPSATFTLDDLEFDPALRDQVHEFIRELISSGFLSLVPADSSN